MLRVPDTGDFLLDTGCFYRLSGNTCLQTSLLALHERLFTCPLAVLEIAALPADCPEPTREFARRKKAMQTLYSVTDHVVSVPSEVVTARAFNEVLTVSGLPDADNIMRAVLLADSVGQMENGVPDVEAGLSRTVRSAEIRKRKAELDQVFMAAASCSSASLREEIQTHVAQGEPNTHNLPPKEWHRWLKKHAFRSYHALTGVICVLAKQVGILSSDEIDSAFVSDAGIAELRQHLLSRYDGSLDSYVRMFLAYNGTLLLGYVPKRNDAFDLEFFKYLGGDDAPTYFVTTDDRWTDLGRDALPGRVIAFGEFMDALSLITSPWRATHR
jgi:hypothetical protein